MISAPPSAGLSQGLRIAVWCGQRRGLSPPPPVCPDRAVREEGGFSLEEQRGAAPTGGCVPSSASPPLAPQSPHGTGDPPHSRRIPGPKDSGRAGCVRASSAWGQGAECCRVTQRGWGASLAFTQRSPPGCQAQDRTASAAEPWQHSHSSAKALLSSGHYESHLLTPSL